MKKRTMLNTPRTMTLYMSEALAKNLQRYAGFSNAMLCTIDYVEGPVWAMQAYVGKITHWAILEETGQLLYIYAGPLKPKPIIPQGQFYHRTFSNRAGKTEQTGAVIYNERMEVCIRWIDD